MDFLGFASWGRSNDRASANRVALTPSQPDFEGLDTMLRDAHLRRDIARRPDLARFVRDEAA